MIGTAYWELHITEETLQEHVRDANQVVILLGFIEGSPRFPQSKLCLSGRTGWGDWGRGWVGKENINLILFKTNYFKMFQKRKHLSILIAKVKSESCHTNKTKLAREVLVRAITDEKAWKAFLSVIAPPPHTSPPTLPLFPGTPYLHGPALPELWFISFIESFSPLPQRLNNGPCSPKIILSVHPAMNTAREQALCLWTQNPCWPI